MELDAIYEESLKTHLIQKTKVLWNFALDNTYYLRTINKTVDFEITYQTNILNMALCLDNYKKNFCIKKLIINSKFYRIQDPEKQFWRQVSMTKTKNKSVSSVLFTFKGFNHGTYYQTFVFQDFALNYYRTRILIDYLHPYDVKRMDAVDQYLKNQLILISSAKNKPTYTHKVPDPQKLLLERTYPELNMKSLLSHDLVSENLNSTNYCNVMKQLISIEETCRLVHVSRFNCTKQVQLLGSYRLSSEDGSNTTIIYAPNKFLIILELDQDGTEDSAAGKLLLQSCEEVDVTFLALNITMRVKIEDRSHNYIGIRLNHEVLKRHWPASVELKQGVVMDMQFTFIQNRMPFCQWKLAVDLLPNTRLIFPPAECSPEQCQIRSNCTGDQVLNEILNYQQRHAVAMMMEQRYDYKPPILIVGAFGTGKTFTIAHGVKRILETQPDAKILLCTHSNSAADLYVKEYFDQWYTDTKHEYFKPVRIYYPERVKTTVSIEVQKYCLFTNNEQNFRYPFAEDLDQAKIIVTTLVTSFSLLDLKFQPTHIVIDEAAQAFECEAIMPLAKATKRTQLILAGDNLQMQPEVYSHLAALRGFGVSLLERLDKLYTFNNMNKIILRTNYRSHPKIIDVMTSCLYGKRLMKNSKTIENINQEHHNKDGFFKFINVCGVEKKTQHSTGYYNLAEVEEIVKIVKKMKVFWETEELSNYGEGSIGVLSHYAEQVLSIRSALRQAGMHEVSVERIQNVQGKQFHVVIISTVITCGNNRLGAQLNVRNYGLLTDVGLLNTAITRARNIVIVVGDLLALITMGNCQNIWRNILNSTDYIDGITRAKLLENAKNLAPLKTSPLNPEANPFFPDNIK